MRVSTRLSARLVPRIVSEMLDRVQGPLFDVANSTVHPSLTDFGELSPEELSLIEVVVPPTDSALLKLLRELADESLRPLT